VEFDLFLVDEEGLKLGCYLKLEKFDFENVYIGQKKSKKAYIVNNTPNTLRFKQSIHFA